MINFLDYASHVFFFPSLLVSGFLLAMLVAFDEKQNLKRVLFWGAIFSMTPFMIYADALYHGLMHLLSCMMGKVPLMLDVIVDYLSRIVLIPLVIFVFNKKLSVHWSQSLFLISASVGVGYLGMVVGKTQVGAALVNLVAIVIWWRLLWNELLFVRNTQIFTRFGFLGFVTLFSLFVNLAMYVCVRMIEVTPEFLNYLVFVAWLFWLTLTIAVKLIFRMVRLTQQAEIARNHDKLTGLPNELLFSNYVLDLLFRNRKKRYAFVVFDLENFKAFNERLGFEEGDNALRFMASVFKSLFGERYVMHVSCDTFRVVCDVAGVESKIKEAHDKIRGFSTQGVLEIKAGVYVQRVENENVERCFMRARLAEATTKGVYDEYLAVYVDEMGTRERLKMYLISHIDEAVKNEYIKVYYQPVVDINTNKLCGFEALARWDDPEHGFLPPFEFVGILEDAHLIQKLDLFMLKKICEKYRKETNLGHKCVPISFNLSRLDFKLSDIYKELTRLTKEYDVPHKMIHIEITESVLDGDEDGYIREQVTRFQKDGFEVWMDDFGSGFSSLNVLKDYDFDFLKIDMMFLRNFTEKSKVIIRAIVEMAKLLHIGTLSEGVETKEHLDFLKEIGCDRVQGYYYSKPLPYDEVMAVLKEKGVEV
ncbi:MAG: bifunctional diguanylate cyclase/phosphodiesterase [Fibrobacter sp.]|nr:bifunctional diguanylate cyclase/phosphodiesterase [Fibrobacter sp.]